MGRATNPARCLASTGCWLQRDSKRMFSGSNLGSYLERCGATWGDAYEVHQIEASTTGNSFLWRVDLPPQRLATMQKGDHLESPPFTIGKESRGRFQVFPKGDADSAEGMCSLWLCTDHSDLGPARMRVGCETRTGGASDFCLLKNAMPDGVLEVGVEFDAELSAPPAAPVQQSLQLTGLQSAEWHVSNVRNLTNSDELVISPPFRFHHVLLGDMYLELLPGTEHPELCTLFFRCRVPTMKLKVCLSVGDSFSNGFVSQGRYTPKQDLVSGNFLKVNLDAPDVLTDDGTLIVHCALEEVVSLPLALKDMIPKLDERAAWPKRL